MANNVNYVEGGQLHKYFGEQSPWHDGILTWPGLNGIPVINFDSKLQYEGIMDVTIFHYFHSKTFDLANEEDLKYYTWCRDRISNGWFVLLKAEYKWEDSGMKVYMEWVQRYVKQLLHKKFE